MVEYDSIDVTKGTDVNKTNGLLECIICHYFLKISFRFDPVSVKGNDYRIYVWYMNKDEAMYLLRNAGLTEKSGTL